MKAWDGADPLDGLTVVEREIVEAVLDGETLADYSRRKGWGLETARKLADRAACKLPAHIPAGRPLIRLVIAGTQSRVLRQPPKTLSGFATDRRGDAA